MCIIYHAKIKFWDLFKTLLDNLCVISFTKNETTGIYVFM